MARTQRKLRYASGCDQRALLKQRELADVQKPSHPCRLRRARWNRRVYAPPPPAPVITAPAAEAARCKESQLENHMWKDEFPNRRESRREKNETGTAAT